MATNSASSISDKHHNNHNGLDRVITLSPEQFEKLYLSPKGSNGGRKLANPTPLAIAGFLLTLTPISCQLMGWRGADGSTAADTGFTIFCGGLMMFVGGLLEFVLGNTFPFIVFCSFGGFWFTMGGTFIPGFGARTQFQTEAYPAVGQNPQFFNTFSFYILFMGLLCVVFLICSLRTNLVFVGIFFTLVVGLALLSATFWQVGNGNVDVAGKCQKAAGAMFFVTTCFGWYLFLAIMLPSVDFALAIPVGDLSTRIKGARDNAV